MWRVWDGEKIHYSLVEHTVVLTSISPDTVRVNDPWPGTQYWITKRTFETSFRDFGNMAVIF
ncbi:MAG TPA: hypothetical protein VIO62_13530 [Candidatus Dormibacteraeota bacterium]|jgi:uncharacterized protein YvpB